MSNAVDYVKEGEISIKILTGYLSGEIMKKNPIKLPVIHVILLKCHFTSNIISGTLYNIFN